MKTVHKWILAASVVTAAISLATLLLIVFRPKEGFTSSPAAAIPGYDARARVQQPVEGERCIVCKDGRVLHDFEKLDPTMMIPRSEVVGIVP